MYETFVNFLLFDSHFDQKDQSPGDIIFCHSNDINLAEDINKMFILTGVITALNDFSRIFDKDLYCDYMITENYETAFLNLGDDLNFLVSLKLNNKGSNTINNSIIEYSYHINSPNTRKIILKNILINIKKMVFLNVKFPTRDPKTGKFSEQFKEEINVYLPKILELIDWNSISYTNIWNENTFISILPPPGNTDLLVQLNEMQSKNELIFGLILTNRNKVVAHTTDPELATILNFLVKNEYKIYFPYKTSNTKKEKQIEWIIGKIDEINNIVTPPIFWKDKHLALVVLKLNLVKLIIIIDLNKIDKDEDFDILMDLSKPILQQCDFFNNNSNAFEILCENLDLRFKKAPGSKLLSNFETNSIQILANRINTNEIDLINFGVVTANEAYLFIKDELMFDKDKNEKKDSDENMVVVSNKEGLIPFHSGFSLFFEHRQFRFSNMLMKLKYKDLSKILEVFHTTDEII